MPSNTVPSAVPAPRARSPGSCTRGRWTTWPGHCPPAARRRPAPARARWPTVERQHRAVGADQAAREPHGRQAFRAASPHTIAAVLAALAIDARRRRHRDQLPTSPGAVTGGRVDDVVHLAAGAHASRVPTSPNWRGRPGGGRRPHRRWPGAAAQSARIPTAQPSSGRTGDRDVASEVHQYRPCPSRRRSSPRPGRTPAPWPWPRGRGPRLRGREETVRAELEATPPGYGPRQGRYGAGSGEPRRSHGRSRGRSWPPPPSGRRPRRSSRPPEGRRRPPPPTSGLTGDRATVGLVEAGNLRAGPEPAAGPVDGVQLVAQDLLGQVDAPRPRAVTTIAMVPSAGNRRAAQLVCPAATAAGRAISARPRGGDGGRGRSRRGHRGRGGGA